MLHVGSIGAWEWALRPGSEPAACVRASAGAAAQPELPPGALATGWRPPCNDAWRGQRSRLGCPAGVGVQAVGHCCQPVARGGGFKPGQACQVGTQMPCSAREPLIAHRGSARCANLAGCTVFCCPCTCSAADLRMQALAAAHWCAMQAAESAAGGAGLQPCSINRCSIIVQLPSMCPQLVDSSFMALLRQKVASLPMVSQSRHWHAPAAAPWAVVPELSSVAPAQRVHASLWLPVCRAHDRSG